MYYTSSYIVNNAQSTYNNVFMNPHQYCGVWSASLRNNVLKARHLYYKNSYLLPNRATKELDSIVPHCTSATNTDNPTHMGPSRF